MDNFIRKIEGGICAPQSVIASSFTAGIKESGRSDMALIQFPVGTNAAGVFTKDINQATNAVNQLQAGQVYVNSWFTGSIATPFGGYKQSGYSREKGQEAIKGYLQVKNVGIQL